MFAIEDMYKVVKKDQSTIKKLTDNKQAVHYIDKSISPNASLVRAEFDNYIGDHKATTDLIYYVIEGEVSIDFGDEVVKLAMHDSCFISKATEYKMQGTAKIIVVNQPAFGS